LQAARAVDAHFDPAVEISNHIQPQKIPVSWHVIIACMTQAMMQTHHFGAWNLPAGENNSICRVLRKRIGLQRLTIAVPFISASRIQLQHNCAAS
jgi:hypothetical protein